MVFHGYGGSEPGLSTLDRWTNKGYAAFTMSGRGIGRSWGRQGPARRSDIPYSRPTNGQLPVSFSNLELRLPVRQKPGAAGGSVKRPAPNFVPPG